MFLLVKDAELYSPKPLGRGDLLAAGGKILALGGSIDASRLPGEVELLEAGGLPLVPGLVDGHVHLIGGGGEGGFSTRTPELNMSEASRAGVTSLVGVLGTDGLGRSMEALVAKVYGLRAEGLSAYCYTGSYRLPLRTITGDAMKDIMMVEPVIGIGEIAVSDHRSSRPSLDELGRLVSEARVGGMLSGKAGVVNIHLGDAPAGFAPLNDLVSAGEIPRSQLLPTHCGRNPRLYEEAFAWLRSGGFADFTTSTVPRFLAEGEVGAAEALLRAKTEGLDLDRITWSSDGQGSLPLFDASGALAGLTMGGCESLLESLRAALALGLSLEEALLPVTRNPARVLRLAGKGSLEPGADADLLLLDSEHRPSALVSRGRVLLKDGRILVRGAFEPREAGNP